MPNHGDGPLAGDEMLQAVTDAMVALHQRYYGRRPARSHTQMMGDDMLACLFGGMYTDVEKTLIELQRQALVHETRSSFQQAMQHRFIKEVERIIGRRVVRFISTHHVGPDLELELFLLEPRAAIDPGATFHTEGQKEGSRSAGQRHLTFESHRPRPKGQHGHSRFIPRPFPR